MRDKDRQRHIKNNYAWEKIHKQNFYSKFPDTYTVSIFENRFKNKNLKILELGCGSGNNQVYFRKKYYDVTGIDISTNAIKNTKKLLYENKINNRENLYVMDVLEIHNLKKKFDIIYDFRTISNLPQNYIKKIFLNIHQIIKPNGFFIFKLYSNKWLKTKTKKNIGKSKNIFLTSFDKKNLKKIIPNNFKINSINETLYYNLKKYKKITYAEFDLICTLKKTQVKKKNI